ncbi:S8 family serine peptidase [Leptolyngbya sp. FACHB-541]|uniref:S8 family serine peptidase n=1 Tax=Leptolyngbya sp. FACHB-541 TaxID=2692810 RepID=UPI00321FCB76
MNKIDAYLIFEFGVLKDNLEHEDQQVWETALSQLRLNMLVYVSNESWSSDHIPDLEETFRFGTIIGCIGSRNTIEALQEDSEVIYVEASRQSSSWDSNLSEGISTQESTSHLAHSSLGVAVKADRIHQFEKGDKALIAVIDSGIDICHEAFLDATGRESRILAIWDQADRDGTGSSDDARRQHCAFGREYLKEEIDEYLRQGNAPNSLRDLESGHGTHVTSIAAGKPGTHFLGGIAPEAKIVVVKIDLSRGVEASHGNALKYIKDFTERVARLPTVVNVSQGINVGPHDGTSVLERLYDIEFLKSGAAEGYAIVKSAGNERQTRRHAKFNVKNKIPCRLLINCVENARDRDNIQIWFNSAYQLELCVENPYRERTEWVTLGRRTGLKVFSNKNTCKIRYVRHHPYNGDSSVDIFIEKGSANSIADGCWFLEVRRSGGYPEEGNKDIHAWIEIDSSRAVGFEDADECVTLTPPGTAHNIITVAAVQQVDESGFGEDSDSSQGPTRQGIHKPDLVAPGANISGASAGTINGVCRKSGTSMAAPQVSGAIALLLSAWEKSSEASQLNSSQIRAAIRQATQSYNGEWSRSTGFGILNVESLFHQFNLL